jgi:hypothetical protein
LAHIPFTRCLCLNLAGERCDRARHSHALVAGDQHGRAVAVRRLADKVGLTGALEAKASHGSGSTGVN